jgi:hypothetical protein
VLGSALLWVAASMDGSTLFWGHQRSGEALAKRWAPSDRPWRVALPLEGAWGTQGQLAALAVPEECGVP